MAGSARSAGTPYGCQSILCFWRERVAGTTLVPVATVPGQDNPANGVAVPSM